MQAGNFRCQLTHTWAVGCDFRIKPIETERKDMNILDSTWFTAAGGAVIGIVMVEDDIDGVQYFIGPAIGRDQIVDETWIAEHGARFPALAGMALFHK